MRAARPTLLSLDGPVVFRVFMSEPRSAGKSVSQELPAASEFSRRSPFFHADSWLSHGNAGTLDPWLKPTARTIVRGK